MADEWITSNYNAVDIIEYEMTIGKRRRIEDFCIEFFKDWETCAQLPLVQVCQRVIKEKKHYTITRDLSTYLTIDNFDVSFRTMCLELFKDTVKDGHVVSLLVFCIELDTCLQHHTWYTLPILVESLVNALACVQFNPSTWNQSNLIDNVVTSFIIIVPLLFFYILFK